MEHEHEHDAHHQHAHDHPHAPGTPHRHWHRHAPMTHTHEHYPDASLASALRAVRGLLSLACTSEQYDTLYEWIERRRETQSEAVSSISRTI
jgi:hypothetical protein